jgi:hypothetical protein
MAILLRRKFGAKTRAAKIGKPPKPVRGRCTILDS